MAVCTKHDTEETFLQCSSCDRPFCYRCLIQGPVGAKCTACSRGLAVDASGREKVKASVKANDFDRLLPLKVFIGALVAINLVLFHSAGVLSTIAFGPNQYSLQLPAIRSGEWYRLATGPIMAAHIFALVVGSGMAWWVGRKITPFLGALRFFSVVALAIAAGAFGLAIFRPSNDNFGFLSVAGAQLGAYAAIRRRKGIGRLTLPFSGSFGFGAIIFGYFALTYIASDLTAIIAAGGVAVVALAFTWWMIDPIRLPSARPAYVGFAIAALLMGCTAILAQRSTGASHPTFGQLVSNFHYDDPTNPPTGWLRVAMWEDDSDVGDFQTYDVQCTPKPITRSSRLTADETGDATSICRWLQTDTSRLKTHETVSKDCKSVLISRLTVVGRYEHQPVDMSFSSAEGCNSPSTSEVVPIFRGFLY